MIKKVKLILWVITFNSIALNLFAQKNLQTEYFKIHINARGYIDEMENISKTPYHNFAKRNQPSPVLCLYNSFKKKYYYPIKAKFSNGDLILKYDNGSTATVNVSSFKKYIRFTLKSLTNRKDIDDIQWGSFYTNINNLFGEIIGVARDTSEIVNYAIGVLALNDQTTGGPSSCESDNQPFEYIVHNPDTKRFTLPANLHEGKIGEIGGNGINDGDFYCHPESYWRLLYGNSALMDDNKNIHITYHSSDRRVKKTFLFSLIPFKETDMPNHLERQSLDVDYIGSSIALWGSPDSIALMDVIQNIVVSEHLSYPTINGKWIKDPAVAMPDLLWHGPLDSAVSYAKQMGCKAIQIEDEWQRVDRSSTTAKDLKSISGRISHKIFDSICNANGIDLGYHTIMTSLQEGTYDATTNPSENLSCQTTGILSKNIDDTTSDIELTDPKTFNEFSSWEFHPPALNIVKIGKELIHYKGISEKSPYILKEVKRGYFGTKAADHFQGEKVCKVNGACGGDYLGLIPDMYLQDSIADWYAQVAIKNGIRYFDWDGEEFLFDQGHGNYAVKRFHHRLFDDVKKAGIDYLRIMGSTLSEGSWHYQSVWNVGGGFNLKNRTKITELKDLWNVEFANYFPLSIGGTPSIGEVCDTLQWEHLESYSVGMDFTQYISASIKSFESCPFKYKIFHVFKTWENARAANAFSFRLKKELADTSKYFHLEQINNNTWNLYKVNADGGDRQFYQSLKRAPGY